MSRPLVSVVVLNFNGRRWVRPLYRSLLAQTHAELEIVVVDNASRDDSLALIAREFPDPRIRVLRLSRNRGFSAGNNAGIRAARGAYVFLLNNDVVLDPRCIEELVAAAGAHGRFGALAPKIVWYYRPEYIESIGTMCTADGTGFNHGIGHVDLGQFDRSERVFGACFAAAFFRREAFDEVGLLDESYFMYYEDVDWCFRANRLGLPIHTVPTACVQHVHSGSLRYTRERRKQYLLGRNRVRFGLLNMPGTARQLLLLLKVLTPLRYWRLWFVPGEIWLRLRTAAHLVVRLPGLLLRRWRRRGEPRATVPDAEFLDLHRGRESFFVSAELYPEVSPRALAAMLRELFRAQPTPENASRLGLALALGHLADREPAPAVAEAALAAWADSIAGLPHAAELEAFAGRIPEIRAALAGRRRPAWVDRMRGVDRSRPEDVEGDRRPAHAAAVLAAAFAASGDLAALQALGLVLAQAHWVEKLRDAHLVDGPAAERALAVAWQATREELPAWVWQVPGAPEALQAVQELFAVEERARAGVAATAAASD